MQKRFLAAVLAAVMVVCLLPTVAFASAPTSVKLAGTELVSGGNVTYWVSDGAGGVKSDGASEANYIAKYDPRAAAAKLTLNNAVVSAEKPLLVDGYMDIVLIGNSTLTAVAATEYGIYSTDSLAFSGDGSVTATGRSPELSAGFSRFTAAVSPAMSAKAQMSAAFPVLVSP